MRDQLAKQIETGVKAGLPVDQSLVIAGLHLQRVSQDDYVPVDTTALKASAFTCKEEELEAVSAEKFAQSETIRLAESDAERRKLTAKYKNLDAARLVKVLKPRKTR